jgi:hypothetical protein
MVNYEYTYKVNTYKYIQLTISQKVKKFDFINEKIIILSTLISNEKYNQLVQGKNIESNVYLIDNIFLIVKNVVFQTQNEICHIKVTNSL